MLSGPSFGWAFVSRINSLILSGFPLISFHLAEASLSAFWWFYNLVCVQLCKSSTKCLCNYLHFYYSFCNHSVLFTQLENIKKISKNNWAQRDGYGNGQDQNKNKTKSWFWMFNWVLNTSLYRFNFDCLT